MSRKPGLPGHLRRHTLYARRCITDVSRWSRFLIPLCGLQCADCSWQLVVRSLCHVICDLRRLAVCGMQLSACAACGVECGTGLWAFAAVCGRVTGSAHSVLVIMEVAPVSACAILLAAQSRGHSIPSSKSQRVATIRWDCRVACQNSSQFTALLIMRCDLALALERVRRMKD